MRLITMTIFIATGGSVALAIGKPIPNWKAGGMAIPLARYPSFLSPNKSIDLDAISSRGLSVRDGLDNYEMNTGMMHPFAVRRSEPGLRTHGPGASIPLINYDTEAWMGEISIGTPPKNLKVQIDTGGADSWVLQTGCDGISGDRDLWVPDSSESAKKLGTQLFRLNYLDGSIIEGNRYTDNVTLAGLTADPQTFGSVTSYISQSELYEHPADGLLGLAFPSISHFRANPLFESLVKQSRLINPTFSLKLSSSGAEMYIGGANSMLYSGDVIYTRVTDPGFWQVTMDDVRINGDTILENVPAIFDTGSTYIFGDWNRVSELYKRLDGTLKQHGGFGFYYLPCDSFPTVSFTFSGTTIAIPPGVLKMSPIEEGSSNCFSAIIAERSPIAFWTIGTTFLQGVYSVFD